MPQGLSADYKHGKTGYVQISGYKLPSKTFNVKEVLMNEDDVTNARSNGKGESVAGPTRLEGSVECVLDDDNYPAGGLGLRAGAEVTLLNVLYDGRTIPSLKAMITELDLASGVSGAVKYTFSWKSQGDYELV